MMMKAGEGNWFLHEAPRLLDERNRREVDAFSELIQSHQELLFRVQNATSSMTSSLRLDASMDSSSSVTSTHLFTIQKLEQELRVKNAQLAAYAGNQLKLVQESKELMQARAQWEKQLELSTKKLEEEMILSQEKDQAIKELDNALRLVRDELVRHRELIETSESESTSLRQRIHQLEEKLLEKSAMMQEWLAAHEAGDFVPKPGMLSGPAAPSGSSMASQEMAESVSRLFIDSCATASSKLVSTVEHAIRAHATEVNSVCFNASAKILFSGSSDGTVRAWETSSCRAMGEYRGVGTAHPLLCVRVSEDGELVLGTGCDRKCFVWRVGTGRVFQTLMGHSGKVLAGEFSLTSPNEVITGSSDRCMRVWDVSRGTSRQTINCRSSCNDIAMTVGGLFASAHHDGVVRFWDTRTKMPVREMKELHQGQVTSVSFARSGNSLLTNSRDHTLQVIDPRMFTTVQTLKHAGYQCGFDWCKATLSPDGVYAAAGSTSGAMFIWNTITGKLEKELRGGHQGAIASCLWRPDGQGVASCDKNGLVVLWT